MSRIHLVRHGRAAAGWDTDPDPGLDEIGTAQAARVAAELASAGPLAIRSSPLRRCQETASALASTWGVDVVIDERVAEIPSPIGVPMGERTGWLREAMAGTWTAMGERYIGFRDGVASALLTIDVDTVVFSHFVAINAAIGAALDDDRVLIRSLDNCSVTTIDVVDGVLRLIDGGREADTLIR